MALAPFSLVQWVFFLGCCAHSLLFLSKNISA
jgi:hypothetical protein